VAFLFGPRCETHLIDGTDARWVSGNDVRKQNQVIDKLFDLPA
jgi:hypothetical protein